MRWRYGFCSVQHMPPASHTSSDTSNPFLPMALLNRRIHRSAVQSKGTGCLHCGPKSVACQVSSTSNVKHCSFGIVLHLEQIGLRCQCLVLPHNGHFVWILQVRVSLGTLSASLSCAPMLMFIFLLKKIKIKRKKKG